MNKGWRWQRGPELLSDCTQHVVIKWAIHSLLAEEGGVFQLHCACMKHRPCPAAFTLIHLQIWAFRPTFPAISFVAAAAVGWDDEADEWPLFFCCSSGESEHSKTLRPQGRISSKAHRKYTNVTHWRVLEISHCPLSWVSSEFCFIFALRLLLSFLLILYTWCSCR